MEGRRLAGGKLYAQVAARLREMIEDGRLQSGDKLPPLPELAIRFGCSRATIREAVAALRGQGLIELRHGDGTYVRTASLEMWMEPLDAAILLSVGQSRQLIEMMTALLAGVASLAAQRYYLIDFPTLNRVVFELECADWPGEEAVSAELDFYATLAKAVGNGLMENAFRILQEALRSSLRIVQKIQNRGQQRIGLDLCRQLFDCIQAGDDVSARELVFRYGEKLSTELSELRLRRPAEPEPIP